MSTSSVNPQPSQPGTTKVIQVASAKPLRELTLDEKKKRYQELRSKARFADQSQVKGEEHMHYFWANKDDEPELIRLQSIGYEIVKEPNATEVLAGKTKPKIIAAGLKADGTYVRGDLILMHVPQEDYEFFLLDIEQRHEEGMRAISTEFRDEAERQGAPTFEVSRGKK